MARKNKNVVLSDAKAESSDTLLETIESYFDGDEDAAWFYSSPKSGDTISLIAARHGNVKLLQFLQQRIPKKEKLLMILEQTNRAGKRPIHEAAQNGQSETLLFLIEQGVDINSTKQQDWTPLMLACTKTNVDVVACLLDKGADATLKNKDGWNCFHIAAREGDVYILKALLDRHADLWCTTSRNGRTPLHTAALHGRYSAIADVLLAADRCRYAVDVKDSCGCTPLMEAVRAGFVDVMTLLIARHRADIFARDNLGRTLLHIAAEAGQNDSITAILSYNYVTDADDNLNGNPILLSSDDVTNNPRHRRMMNVNARTTDIPDLGFTASEGQTQTIGERMMDVNARTEQGFTAREGQTQTIGERMMDVNARTEQGFTPLYLAAREGQTRTIGMLFRQPGIDINATDRNGRTALHMAVVKKSLPCVKLLLSRGVNDTEDNDGRFARDYTSDASFRHVFGRCDDTLD